MIRYEKEGEVALLMLDHPPVNALGATLRLALFDALARLEDDASVAAVVLIGGGRLFSAGADIAAFASVDAFLEPTLHATLLDRLDAFTKPVVAALHGVALGGGLELALGCHYRIAAPGTRLGLPEITLGLMPGAGGTVRLPRAIGQERALDLIATGRTVDAAEIPGLVDRIGTGDLGAAAVAYAREVAAVRPLPRLRDIAMNGTDANGASAEGLLAVARAAAKAKPHALRASIALIDALEAAATLPFDVAAKREFELFKDLVGDDAGKALRHLFQAERVASRGPAAPTRQINSAAVIGAGTMGRGIALCFAAAGIPVQVVESRSEARDTARDAIAGILASSAKRGQISTEAAEQRRQLIQLEASMDRIRVADVVVEAVFEDMAVKHQVFTELDRVMKPGAILGSNTSSLDLDAIAAATTRPGDVVGLHFFSPAHMMRLVEVVRGAATAPDVLATALKLAGRLGKVPVVSGVCDGFIGNRMVEQMMRQAFFLLDEGALPWQVDRALEAWGMAMGPFRVLDVVGGDIPWAVRKRRYDERPNIVYSRVADRVCERGWFGQKSGRGWYRYDKAARGGTPDPEVAALVAAYSAEIGRTRRTISDTEIVARCVYALVNEGAAILDEGIAARSGDIDLVYVNGYGFPAFRGGPMFHADAVGLPWVVHTMRHFKAQGGPAADFWTPAPMLERLAAEGGTFFAHGSARR